MWLSTLLLCLLLPSNAQLRSSKNGAGASVCFDMESGGHDATYHNDDELNEDTNCLICVFGVPDNWDYDRDKHLAPGEGYGARCKKGLNNVGLSGHDCIDLRGDRIKHCDLSPCHEDWSWDKAFLVSTDCGDSLWIDRIMVDYSDGQGSHTKTWGGSNRWGWCLSTEPWDHNVFGKATSSLATTDDRGYTGRGPSWTRVARTCYTTMKFNTDGTTQGWVGTDLLSTYRQGHLQVEHIQRSVTEEVDPRAKTRSDQESARLLALEQRLERVTEALRDEKF